MDSSSATQAAGLPLCTSPEAHGHWPLKGPAVKARPKSVPQWEMLWQMRAAGPRLPLPWTVSLWNSRAFRSEWSPLEEEGAKPRFRGPLHACTLVSQALSPEAMVSVGICSARCQRWMEVHFVFPISSSTLSISACLFFQWGCLTAFPRHPREISARILPRY